MKSNTIWYFPKEVNPDEGKNFNGLPCRAGHLLLGKQEGDEITIPLPGQQKEFEIYKNSHHP